ncbi:NinB family protein [Corticibacter populi]|uniref:NinB family protein n=1 Tax=Corticibacter populi TaxID=1550736 RepID=A0A3M6R1A0_9BURK|nr:recombination protein NinB [Corticibacter populi]RMX08512.1 NinB family protein [Corticibacter populi]RZS35825.1 NinB protein [Corticibacter populi]
MSDRQTFTVRDAVQGYPVMQRAWQFAKANVMAGRPMLVEVRPLTRSLEQNARLHASIADIARQKEWGGKRWTVEEWKRLLAAAWCRAKAQGVEMVPAIDGQGFDVLYQRTSTLTKAECADLLDYIYSWGVKNGVVFTDPAPEGWEA